MATLVLLQRDLRQFDNPALYNAVRRRKPIIVVHVMEKRLGSTSKWWLCKSLRLFRQQLEEWSIPLLHLDDSANFSDMIDYLNDHIEIEQIYSNGLDFELPDNFVEIHESFLANLIFIPEDMTKEFKIFTPFWKSIRKNCSPVKPLPNPDWCKKNHVNIEFDEYNELPMMMADDRWNQMESYWEIGEKAAQKRLELFVKTKLSDYDHGRDFFHKDGTSKLSPHLRFGEISVRQIYEKLNNKSNERFCSELGWREFAYHVYRNHGDMAKIPLNPKYCDFWPEYNDDHLNAWRNGQTGYPVIDAAMRDLSTTGWMHNRLRMLVASFLVKNLLIPWQIGEEWFYDHLVDADPAVNPFSWQWVAGCGTDSVPYFRIFNPMLQGEKFDPQGIYVRKWLPEFADFPMKRNIHQDIIKQPNLRPENYPQPIIDFKSSRERTLSTYKAIVAAKVIQLKKPRLP
ncbi:deoxyribodipyrimidine photo-lyase-like protein [Euroglyphus maynei]|uniref:Deoxyribodipyrimidine photo-lyase-like protein n=1 Tax=Euroglyphus maynei TaxID=6958 RepID=A0A1Y3BC08_EURMA|nr:deoxyribodipyrimidine photo-lyase-like protein [Euroglyphus maynei]